LFLKNSKRAFKSFKKNKINFDVDNVVLCQRAKFQLQMPYTLGYAKMKKIPTSIIMICAKFQNLSDFVFFCAAYDM
jgi:hypothetical protein